MTWGNQPASDDDTAENAADTPSSKKVVRMPLDTSRDCQKALARLIRRTLAGDMQTADLSRFANAIMVLSRLIEGGEIERRLEALEAQAA